MTQQCIAAVSLDRQAIAGSTRLQQLFRPEPGVENGVGMNGIDPNAVCGQFQRRNAAQLGEAGFCYGIGTRARSGRR